MKECSRFVCIKSDNINFLIPSSQVATSVYCTNSNYFVDDLFVFENNMIPYVDFYNDHYDDENYGNKHCVETALVIKNKELFDDQQYFAMITTKECSVLELEYKNFSLFSKKFEKEFRNKGFIACYFSDNKIFYLIDIEVFLRNFQL